MLFLQLISDGDGYRGLVGDCDTCAELYLSPIMERGAAFGAAERFIGNRTGEAGAYHNLGTDDGR